MSEPERQTGEGQRGWGALGMLGAAALVCALLAMAVAVWSFVPLVYAWTAAGVGDVGALEAEQQQRVGRYATQMQERVGDINGRSMFFVPPAPDDLVVEEKEEGPEDEGPAPEPRRYGGPSVIAVVNGEVWFSNDRRVAVGEEGGGVRVVNIAGSPWDVRLEWRGVEFDVEIFERTTDRFLTKKRVARDE